VYHVIGGVNEVAADSLPDPDILPDQNPLGIVVAGSVKLYHELQPTEQLFGPADDDGCGHFAEVTIAEPTTDYYIADGTGVTILGDTVHAALDGGFELPPIREQ
jgi:hypothetical protein